ncbi:MAG TPA: glycosyltransferase [Acidimicrobiales bacterium]|nr:glycosyltransferase [Acidimicrobiales bacterium]
MRTTLVVPTYQRRDAVTRLLRALAPQAVEELDVVVVVDGSTDGTAAAVRALAATYPVPVTVVEQANAGLAAARNAGLRAIEHDGVAWFLDDDMVPSDALVACHVAAHDTGGTRVVMGPCLFPRDHDVVGMNRDWADHVHASLAAIGHVDRVELFHAANTSAPVALWRQVGGFHEGFVGWGAEDHECGLRVLAAGVRVDYDVEAIAWHLQHRSIAGMCRTKEGEGANGVRLARLHPDQLDVLFPAARPGRDARLLRPLRRRPGALRGAARVAALVATVEHRAFGGRRQRCFDLAVFASRVAGIASVDGDGPVLSRVLDGGATAVPAVAR